MSIAATELKRRLPSAPWGSLPSCVHLLFIAGPQRTGGWLADAFAVDNAMDVVLEEAGSMASGLAKLRDELFDAVLISHEGPVLDGLELLDAIRAGGNEEQSVVVLGAQSEQEMSALCYEAGADAYVCVNTTTTRALIWTVARAMERRRLIADNRRMDQVHRHHLQLENDEAHRLLSQQRLLIERLSDCGEPHPQKTDGCVPRGDVALPESLVSHYRELLRTHVIMGSGNLGVEMTRLTELLASAGVTAQQALQTHVRVLDDMIQGLGSRSARHVMTRADLLILELMTNLAEGYRKRFVNRLHPPRQLLLPGFDGQPSS